MNTLKRTGNRWTINEILSLQREYELLNWTIQQIAEKHQRSERSILFKVETEEFVQDIKEIYSEQKQNINNEDNISLNFAEENVTEVHKLSSRIWDLENNVSEISSMIKQLLETKSTHKVSSKVSSNVSSSAIY